MQINWHKIVSKSEEMNKIAPFLPENSLARMKLSYKVVANRLRLPGRPRYITIYNRNTLRDPAAAVPCPAGFPLQEKHYVQRTCRTGNVSAILEP